MNLEVLESRTLMCVTAPVCHPVPPPPCHPAQVCHPAPCKPAPPPVPSFCFGAGSLTITEGCNKVTIHGETVCITGKTAGGCKVNQTWWGDVHVNDNIAHTSVEEALPVTSLSNLTVVGVCVAKNTELLDTVICGKGWDVVYNNATSQIVSMTI